MHVRLPHSLKFQITTALLVLILLFTGAKTYTYLAIVEHQNDHVILTLAAKLQLTAEQITSQGFNYKENAPRDYDTYYRDLRLYYQDLMAHMHTFDQVTNAFMSGSFPPEITNLHKAVHPLTNDATRQVARTLEQAWYSYRKDLMEALGDDPKEPRLEYAAQYIVEHRGVLDAASDRLMSTVQSMISTHLARVNFINRVALALSLLVAGVIIAWFYVSVLHPLGRTVAGFNRVAQGDFGHQIPVRGHNEIAAMTEAFNHLSARLNALFQLIDELQRGSDLEGTLRIVGEAFGGFLPIDWVGLLFLTRDGTALKLEKAWAHGDVPIGERRYFSVTDTLVSEAMASGTPLHLSNLNGVERPCPCPGLRASLSQRGMRAAIVLPLRGLETTPAVLTFATRSMEAYTPGQLELLANVAHLVTHSLGRTVRLAEHARLAAIGGFASGIAHEIRNPLATINLALEYFQRPELPEGVRRRADLAIAEAERMERLLEDILLYAKPLSLSLEEVDLRGVLSEFLATHERLTQPREQHLELDLGAVQAHVMADRDRLTQVLLNLTQNACEAAPAGASICWSLDADEAARTVVASVHNPGDPIPETRLARLTEAFFTTKPQGTGLGLSIVKRIVEAHGGELAVASAPDLGTTVSVVLPAGGNGD